MIVIALAGVRTFQAGIATITYRKNLKKNVALLYGTVMDIYSV
jgi:hypothetical protein